MGNQANKKLTIKIGGGGAVGAFVLLGGALATAALASFFLIGKKERSSGKDRRRRSRSPAPKQTEKDEADILKLFVFPESSEAIKEVEADNDTAFLVSNQSSTPDSKSITEEINVEKPDKICDIDTCEQILCLNSPKKLEIDANYEENFAFLDEKLQFKPENVMMHEDEVVTLQLAKEDEIQKEIQNLNQMHIEKGMEESEFIDNDENKGTSHQEAIETTEEQPKQEEVNEVCYDHEDIKVILVDNAVEEVRIAQKEVEENACLKGELEEGQKGLLSGLVSHIMEHENVNDEEREGHLTYHIVEIIKENASEEDDQMKHVEVQMVREQEKCVRPDEIIAREEIREDPIEVTKEDNNPCVMEDENACVIYPTPQNMELGSEMLKEDRQNDLEKDVKKEDEEISSEDEEKSQKNLNKNVNNETALSDEVGLVDQEVGGKIQEDKAIKKHDRDSDEKCNSERTLTKKYVAELRMLKDHRAIIIATLCVLSSLGCSWFSNLSFVELCPIVVFTMLLSSIMVIASRVDMYSK